MAESFKLPPIYVSVAGPSGVGKTTLIATIMRDVTNDLPAPFKVSPATLADAERIAKFNRKLQAAISAESFTFNSQALGGTQEIAVYEYRIEYKDMVQQPFDIMDIPGGWLWVEKRPVDQWQRYEEHLHRSSSLWIPVEAPLLMEAKTPDEKNKAALFLMTTDVRDVVEQWAKYRELEVHRDEPAVLCFAPIKCETYFSRASKPNIPDRFYEAFMLKYTEIVNIAKSKCPRCEIFYAPVESIGCVKLQKMDWHLKSEDQAPTIRYTILPPYHQVIVGVEGLTSAIYQYGAKRINDWLESIRNSAIQTGKNRQQEYDNRGFWTKVIDLFGGGEGKREEINQLEQKAKQMEGELALLGDVLAQLANRSRNCPYFRKLL
jgi:GTP-binding protein EngB required for normal cell division